MFDPYLDDYRGSPPSQQAWPDQAEWPDQPATLVPPALPRAPDVEQLYRDEADRQGLGPDDAGVMMRHFDPCTTVNAKLDPSGEGYYTYDPAFMKYGQPGVITLLKQFAAEWHEKHPDVDIGIGDISSKGGRRNKKRHPQDGHPNGVNVDIRPIRTDRAHDPTNIHTEDYDHDMTNELVQELFKLEGVDQIIFNDPDIDDTVKEHGRSRRHDNHAHVHFRSGAGCK